MTPPPHHRDGGAPPPSLAVRQLRASRAEADRLRGELLEAYLALGALKARCRRAEERAARLEGELDQSARRLALGGIGALALVFLLAWALS